MALLETSSRDEAEARLGAYLDTQKRKGLLRFLTCGSVDDGKSTLIGRLLYDTKLIFEDQLADPALYEKDPVGATRLAKERSELSGQIARHEEKWLEMSAEYEAGVAE